MKKHTPKQFDYPDQKASSFKGFKPDNALPDQRSKHFKEVITHQRHAERQKVQATKEKNKQLEEAQYKQQLLQQIEEKKRELQELEQARLEAIEQQKLADEMAALRRVEDEQNRLRKEEQAKQYAYKAKERFGDALKWVQNQNQRMALKERQAQQRRRAAEEMENYERQQSLKYQQQQLALKLKEEQNLAANKGLTAYIVETTNYGKNIDFTKTRLHAMVTRTSAEVFSSNAENAAQIQNAEAQRKSQEKSYHQSREKERSLQRGEAALEKIRLQREYQDYLKQNERRALQYNLEKIAAGKRNQFTGIKPTTLHQMEGNKKIRSEQEFEAMFLSENDPEWMRQPAARCDINIKRAVPITPAQKVDTNIVTEPCLSRGTSKQAQCPTAKYSFEQDKSAPPSNRVAYTENDLEYSASEIEEDSLS